MNRLFLLFFLLGSVLVRFPVFAQGNRSEENQYYFIKTWGFLKYHHPAFASGKIDPDSVFVSVLSAIDRSGSGPAFQREIASMIQKLNAASARKATLQTPAADALVKNVDRSWFESDAFLGKRVRKLLREVYSTRYTGNDHYYYTEKNYGGEIPHEKAYSFADTANLPYAYRMLTLARFSGAIDYLFPHRYRMDRPWDAVLKAFIPMFAVAADRRVYEEQLLRLSSTINDTHTFSFYKELKHWRAIFRVRRYAPFDYALVNDSEVLVTKLIIPEYCQAAGIKIGDRIMAVNGVPIKDRIRELEQLLCVSNKNALMHRVADYKNNLLFTSDSVYNVLNIKQTGAATTVRLQWVEVQQKDLLSRVTQYLVDKQTSPYSGTTLDYVAPGIVRFSIGDMTRFVYSIPDDRFANVMDSLLMVASHGKGIIFDMRGYPTWAGFIYSSVHTLFAKNRSPHAPYYALDKQNIGTFVPLRDESTYHYADAEPRGYACTARVVILVSGETLSLSEFQAMHLQQIFPGSVTMGEQTAGADGDEKVLTLPGGYRFHFTGNAIFYPDGGEAQRTGVRIDTMIPSSPDDLTAGKDTLLQKAIDLIESR